MKIEVEIKDFVIDEYEEKSLEMQFQDFIIHKVFHEIWGRIDDTFRNKIFDKIEAGVKKLLIEKTDTIIDEIIKTASFGDRYNKTKQLPIKDYVMSILENDSWNGSSWVYKKVEDIAQQLSVQLKTRYDMFFATQIVSKMHQNNMLNEQAIKSLIEDKK